MDLTKQIQNDILRLDKQFIAPTTIPECSIALRVAKRKVKEILRQSFDIRVKERDAMIIQYEQSPDSKSKKKANILKQIKRSEAVREMFRKLKFLRNPSNNSTGITRIKIPVEPDVDPQQCTQWQEIDVPTDILMHLQKRNQRHFGQAHGSPFTIPPLSTDLGFCGDTPDSEAILSGLYNTTSLSPPVRLLINHLSKAANLNHQDNPASISMEDFCGKLRNWRESTSTSPSGLHLGHYRALVARHEYSEEDKDHAQRIEMDQIQADLCSLHLNLLNYALTRGYSYNRWHKIVNAMLFKEPNNIRIHRTRVIHLYEADYNLAMGVKWRTALFQSAHAKSLNDGQYGSRPNRNAHDPVFLEEFQFEISRASRKSVVHTSFDAASCYDRIIPNLAGLASQRYGVPFTVVQSYLSTLHQAKYHVKTELGISKTFYSHKEGAPIYGTGQGSGNSPVIWCMLSSLLFDCFTTQAFGASYIYPDGSHRCTTFMIGYVDDCNGQVNDFLAPIQPPIQDLIDKAKHDAQHWNNVLCASGGTLEPTKCSIQAMTWLFTIRGAPVLQPGDIATDRVTLLDDQGRSTKPITGLSAYTAHKKTLGHYKDPAGNQHEQMRQLQKKCNESAQFLQQSFLTRIEAKTYYQSIFLSGTSYPLASCHLTKDELDHTEAAAMNMIFSRRGFNQKTKRLVLYGPSHLGGGSFISLYTLQSIGQITHFLKYWRSPSQAGKLLRTAVAWTQYALGTAISFLHDVSTNYPHMEVKWLASVRTYLKVIGGQIELYAPFIPSLEREYDSYIMDNIMQHRPKFTNSEICQLNYCRLYLNVVTVSDLTNAAANELDRYILQGQRSTASSSSKWYNIHQERPSETQWVLWRRANQLWGQNNHQLIQPMGRWIVDQKEARRSWIHYYDSQHKVVYQRDDIGSQQFILIQDEALSCMYFPFESQANGYHTRNPSTQPVRLPDLPMIPVDLAEFGTKDHSIRLQTNHKTLQRFNQRLQIRKMPPSDFNNYIQSLDQWEVDLLRLIQLKCDAFILIVKLDTQSISAASDGSIRLKNHGSFGWILSTDSGERVASAMGRSSSRKSSNILPS